MLTAPPFYYFSRDLFPGPALPREAENRALPDMPVVVPSFSEVEDPSEGGIMRSRTTRSAACIAGLLVAGALAPTVTSFGVTPKSVPTRAVRLQGNVIGEIGATDTSARR